jgi:hypothetical protein
MTRKQTQTLHLKIVDFIRRHEDLTYAEMSKELGIPVPTLGNIALKYGIRICRKSYANLPDLLAKLEQ